MADTDKKTDEKKGDDILRRMLKMPHEPHVKPRESNRGLETKPDGHPAKNDRPEDRD